MHRRDFLTRTGALISASFASLPLSGSATAGGITYDQAGEPDVAAFGRRLDAQLTAIRSEPTPFLDEVARAEGLPGGWVPAVCASLGMAAVFRDLPPEAQQHPEMQERMRAEAHQLGRHVLRAARFLRGLGRERRRALRKALRDDPELGAWLAGRVRARAPREVESERVDQLDDTMERVIWRFRNQDPAILIDEAVGHVDRAAAEVGLEPSEWDDAIDDDGVADSAEALPADEVGTDRPTETRARRTARVGLKVLAIGLGIGAVGTLGILAGGSGGVIFGLFTITAGVLVIIAALIVFLVAAAQTGAPERFDPEVEPPADVPAAGLRTDGRYEGALGGMLVGITFGTDGLVVGTWATTGAPSIRTGTWAKTGETVSFQLVGGGVELQLEARPHADGLDVGWTSGADSGTSRFRFVPGA